MPKMVTWIGGPEDGQEFEVPDGGVSIDVVLPALPPSLVSKDSPQRSQARIARVPLVYTPHGWRALWLRREERDW